ncbi:flagellar hook-basal body protein [Paenibacillus sp. IITD108]|uniref:flagellar hook-basal body protein n=1 Tax=Paenibacillus sp. IITD108 TaxID=3116649 RepID=UPI002F41FFC5
MLRGLYSAASGLIAQQRRHDTVTNNIANINTPGYKQVDAVTRSFPEMLLSATRENGMPRTEIGRWNSGVFAEEGVTTHRQGDLVQTNRFADFAIISNIEVAGLTFDASGKAVTEDGEIAYQPQAFFTVQGPNDEIRYTRGGKFSVSEDGFLLSSDGYRVLGANRQPIQLPANTTIDQLTLTEDRRFIDQAGNDIGVEMLISRIDNPNELIREGNGNFRFADEEQVAEALGAGERVEVRQGFMERSNVDVSQAAIDLMAAMRAYEANQKVVQFYDQSLQKAVNEVGRI